VCTVSRAGRLLGWLHSTTSPTIGKWRTDRVAATAYACSTNVDCNLCSKLVAGWLTHLVVCCLVVAIAAVKVVLDDHELMAAASI